MTRRFVISPEQLFVDESRLQANCFSVKRSSPVVEGFELSFEQGPNQGNPWAPHVNVGGWRIMHDSVSGCAYKVLPDGRGLIRRAALRTCFSRVNDKEFFTLVRPEMEKPGFSLVKVNLRLPGVNVLVKIGGRPLDLYVGSSGGRLVEAEGYEALIELKEGEKLNLFFPDGAVRRFIREGKNLVERQLTAEDQLRARITQAWSVLEEQAQLLAEKSDKAMAWTLRGMVDLVNLTKVMDRHGEGHELRLMLLREFFLELDPDLFMLCERNLFAALHQVDPALVEVARGTAPARTLPEGVADLDHERRKQGMAKDAAARRARQLERSRQGPPKGASGGGKQKPTSNPKVAARRARKHGHAA